jgi:hypothetical protein
MNKVLRSFLGVGLGVLGIAVLTPVADARSIGAWAGAPLDGVSSNCYAENAGGVRGTGAAECPTSGLLARWEVNLPIDSTGPFPVTFASASGAGGTGLPCCVAYAVSQLGVITNTTPELCSGSAMAFHPLSSIAVPLAGHLFLACRGLLTSQNQIASINW